MRTEAEEESATMATTTATKTVATTTRLTTRKPFSFCLPAFYLNWERETQTNQTERMREREGWRVRETDWESELLFGAWQSSCQSQSFSLCVIHELPETFATPSASSRRLRLQLPIAASFGRAGALAFLNLQLTTSNVQRAACNLQLATAWHRLSASLSPPAPN